MTDFLSRLARGFEAARAGWGADEIAHTNRFDLAHSGYFPVASLKRRRDGGDIVVEVAIGDAMVVMTPAEFARFAEELAAFRGVVEGAVEAAKRVKG